MGILAVNFLFVYLPLSGWVLQSVLVGVYLEYLKPKKTIVLVAVMEVFFMVSYGGSVAVAAIVSLVDSLFFVPVIIGLYIALIMAVMLLGYLTNYLPQNPSIRKIKTQSTQKCFSKLKIARHNNNLQAKRRLTGFPKASV